MRYFLDDWKPLLPNHTIYGCLLDVLIIDIKDNDDYDDDNKETWLGSEGFFYWKTFIHSMCVLSIVCAVVVFFFIFF